MSTTEPKLCNQTSESNLMTSPLQPPATSLITDASTTVSSLPQPYVDPLSNQKESVELQAVAKDFPNLMKFTSTPAMLDLCIVDALMPSPRFMEKMTHDEGIITPPSSIPFADEALMQAGSPPRSAGVKQQQLQSGVSSPTTRTASLTIPKNVLNDNLSSNSGIKQGAWSKPLQIAGLSSRQTSQEHGVNQYSAISTEWPGLSREGSIAGSKKSSVKLNQTGLKQLAVPHVLPQENTRFVSNDKEYPWAARMKGKCNLHQVTIPTYMEDGTPLVSIPSHILLEGVENQKEYVVGQFYRCIVPSGGQTHAVVNRLWGRKGRIFTRKLGEFSYLFHIPDEPTRDWVIQRGLWHVDDCLMFVSPWSPSETISLPAISTVPVWLTLKNIPNQLYSFKGIDWIASGIGAPMLSSKPWLDPTQMGEAKILVEVKLSNPFPQKVALKDKSGSITMVDVLYSWLPPKCPTCNQLGHKASRCLGLLSTSAPTVHVTTKETNVQVSTRDTNAVDTSLVSVSSMLDNGVLSTTQALSKQPTFEPSTTVQNLATSTVTQSVPSETALPCEAIMETDVSPGIPLFSVEEPNVIQTPSLKDGNATTISQASPSFSMVTHSNPFSVLENHKESSDKSEMCLMETEEVDEDDRIATMEIRESDLDPETVLDEDDYGPRSRVGRPLRPTQKIQEHWITVGGRGNRGKRGRGGHALFNP